MIEIDRTKRIKRPTALISVSHDDARQTLLEDRTLYVLGFSLAGAILADAFLLIYFTSLSS